MRRVWIALGGVTALGLLVAGMTWFMASPNSVLFRDVLHSIDEGHAAPFTLIDQLSGNLIWAPTELEALQQDDFIAQNITELDGKALLMCGTIVLPINTIISFRRESKSWRFDKYSYQIDVAVNSDCVISSAMGTIGQQVLP